MPDLTGQLPYRRPRCSSPCPCAATLQAAVQVRDLEPFQVDHQVTVVRWKLISLCFLASQWASFLVHPPLVEATRTASRLAHEQRSSWSPAVTVTSVVVAQGPQELRLVPPTKFPLLSICYHDPLLVIFHYWHWMNPLVVVTCDLWLRLLVSRAPSCSWVYPCVVQVMGRLSFFCVVHSSRRTEVVAGNMMSRYSLC